ncbi:hypothetical protein BX666DRAFT_1165764 [Dichotomocladium elegans]|nr:hypothetical protein BX666DRAFT_1165764 [Dichotomocladium elegans]
MTMADEDTCAVCDDPHSDEKNQIIYCDGPDCNMPLHQGCYNVARIPEGDWYCDRCKLAKFNKRVNIVCCPNQTGPVKRIASTNEFIHVVCAKFNKNVNCNGDQYHWKKNLQNAEVCLCVCVRWAALGELLKRFILVQKCYICKKNFGLCIHCDNFDCARSFHVTCAINSGLIALGRPLPLSKPHFCNDHNPSLRMLAPISSPSTNPATIPAKRPYKPKQIIRQGAHISSDSDSDNDNVPLSVSHPSKNVNKKPKSSENMDRPQKPKSPLRLAVAKPANAQQKPGMKNPVLSSSGPFRPSTPASAAIMNPHQRQQPQPLPSNLPNPSRLSPSSSPQATVSSAPSSPNLSIPLIAPTAPELQSNSEELHRDIRFLRQKLESEKKRNLQLTQEARRVGDLQKELENKTNQMQRLNAELEEYRELKHKVTDIFMELNIGTTNGTYPSRDGIKRYIDILHETIRRTRMPTNDEWSEITTFATNLANARSTNLNSSSGTLRPR